MRSSTNNVAPLSQAKSILTKNGESCVAPLDVKRLACCDHIQRGHLHLLLIDEASKGLDDITVGRVKNARSAIQSIKRRRSA